MFDLQKENKIEYFYIFKFKFKEVKVFNVPFTFNFKDYHTLAYSFYDNNDKYECILNVNFPSRKFIIVHSFIRVEFF